MTSRADHIHFASIDRVSFGCSVYQMATRIAITRLQGPVPSVSRVRSERQYTFPVTLSRVSAFNHQPSPYCPTQFATSLSDDTLSYSLTCSSTSSHPPTIDSSVMDLAYSSSRAESIVASAAYQFLTTDWFSTDEIFLAYEHHFFQHGFFSSRSMFALFRVGSRCLPPLSSFLSGTTFFFR